jgi:predicted transcriptional regulator
MPRVIKTPEELAHELDRLAGAEHKPSTACVVDVLWRDVRRNKQREALREPGGAVRCSRHRQYP